MNVTTIIIAITFVLSFLLGWFANGWRLNGQVQAHQNAQSTHIIQQARVATDKAQQSDLVGALSHKTQREKARVIEKEVIRYVKSPAAAQPLSADWVQLHDQAAGVLPSAASPSGSIAATGSTATTGEALAVVTQNYDICQQELIRLSRWQAWWSSVKP